MAKSPAAIPFSTDSVEMGVKDGLALPADTRGFIGVGFDGTYTRFIRTDSSGRQIIIGAGTAGTPAGGVVSIQGVSGGQPIPVSDGGGSLTTDTLQLPTALVGGRLDVVVGTSLPAGTNNIGDVDVLTVPAPLSTTGGGTEALALRVTLASDSTGLVSVDDNGGSLTVDTPQLPAALVGARLDTNVGAWLGSTAPTVGQKAMAASLPVVVASDQSAIPVSQDAPPWAVKGTDADGAPPTESPVLGAGWDGTNVRRVKTNTSGRVEQVLYDSDGNPVAVMLDNSIYRLETRTTVVGQALGAGAEKKVTTIDDVEVANQVRLQTEARLAPGSQVNIGTVIPSDPATLYLGFLEDSGGSENMLVDGDPTPIEFSFVPDAGVVVSLQSLLLVFTADDFSFDGASFGSLAALTNGIIIEVTVDSVNSHIFTIFQNEDFLRIPGRLPLVNNTGPKDLLGAVLVFGGLIQLIGDDGDKITVTVQDDLTSVKLKYLTATMYGIEMT
jgi:hypothetical protein